MRQIEDYRVISHYDKFIKLMDEQMPAALEAVGMQMEHYAKLLCPVDTGLLRNSITHAMAGRGAEIKSYHADKGKKITGRTNEEGEAIESESFGFGFYSGSAPVEPDGEPAVYVGTNVEYAAYQELGDFHHQVGQSPYLKPAATGHTDEYKAIAKYYLQIK